MATLKNISHQAVLQAVTEFDNLGREAFLKRYDFEMATDDFLLLNGSRYDSKAIMGAAHGYEFPSVGPLSHKVFSGGKDTVGTKLRSLGFAITYPTAYWAFCANPKYYRIRDAIRNLTVDHWTIRKGSQPHAGDLALIWKSKYNEGNAGVVAFAKILGAPEIKDDYHNPFWIDTDKARTPEPRVPLRYIVPDKLPVWDDNPKIGADLGELSVAKAKGGTFFKVTKAQWQKLSTFFDLESSMLGQSVSWSNDGDIDPNDELELHRSSYDSLPETEGEAVVKSRKGQGKFRQALIDYWNQCAVTGLAEVPLLKASHIKAWCYSDNAERLDPFNGLLLCPNLDALFDRGYISFGDDGALLRSGSMDSETCEKLGVTGDERLANVDDRHLEYLRFHRQFHTFH